MKVTVLRAFPYAEDGLNVHRLHPGPDPVDVRDELVNGLVVGGYVTHPGAEGLVRDAYAGMTRQALVVEVVKAVLADVEKYSDDDIRAQLVGAALRVHRAGPPIPQAELDLEPPAEPQPEAAPGPEAAASVPAPAVEPPPADPAPPAAPVEMPNAWRDLHWTQRVKLAKDLGASDTIDADQATAFLEAKEAERAGQAQG